jgi:glycosyltransferase involved in cell wall biosynthesis
VIVDTGSTDGTQELIREALADLPGALIERPWVDFAHNRNEALAAARGRCDYILLIDADDTVAFDGGLRAAGAHVRRLPCRDAPRPDRLSPQATGAQPIALAVHGRGSRVHPLRRGPDRDGAARAGHDDET